MLAEKGQGGTPHSMGLEGIRDRRSPRVRAGEAGEGQTTGGTYSKCQSAVGVRGEIPAGDQGEVGLSFPDGVSQTSEMLRHLGR